MSTSRSPVVSPRPDVAEDLVYRALLAMARGIDHVHESGLLVRRSGVALDRALHPVLVTIGERGPLRTTELASALALRTPTVSRHVMRLEELGLVDRTDAPGDRRASRLSLSAQGRETFGAIRGSWLAILTDVFTAAGLDQPDTFADQCLRFGTALEAAR